MKTAVSLFRCFALIFRTAVSLFRCFALIFRIAVSLFRCFEAKLFRLFRLFRPIIFSLKFDFFLFFFSTILSYLMSIKVRSSENFHNLTLIRTSNDNFSRQSLHSLQNKIYFVSKILDFSGKSTKKQQFCPKYVLQNYFLGILKIKTIKAKQRNCFVVSLFSATTVSMFRCFA